MPSMHKGLSLFPSTKINKQNVFRVCHLVLGR